MNKTETLVCTSACFLPSDGGSTLVSEGDKSAFSQVAMPGRMLPRAQIEGCGNHESFFRDATDADIVQSATVIVNAVSNNTPHPAGADPDSELMKMNEPIGTKKAAAAAPASSKPVAPKK